MGTEKELAGLVLGIQGRQYPEANTTIQEIRLGLADALKGWTPTIHGKPEDKPD